jgi:hypothetical protein
LAVLLPATIFKSVDVALPVPVLVLKVVPAFVFDPKLPDVEDPVLSVFPKPVDVALPVPVLVLKVVPAFVFDPKLPDVEDDVVIGG